LDICNLGKKSFGLMILQPAGGSTTVSSVTFLSFSKPDTKGKATPA
jgi:hypothetical protein